LGSGINIKLRNPGAVDVTNMLVFREVFEMWNSNCAKAVTCSDLLSIDETHYPMKTPIAFQ
jgi:hypothetical protein